MVKFISLMYKFCFDIMKIRFVIFDTDLSFFNVFMGSLLVYFVFYIFFSVTD